MKKLTPTLKTIVNFHSLYYKKAPNYIYWFGVPLMKCPLDLWIYQELIIKNQPDLIIETGTWYGGTSLFMAMVCDGLGKGEIITIDKKLRHEIKHPRITQITGSSIDKKVVAKIENLVGDRKNIMVILDSNHSTKHVSLELEIYSKFVDVGGYLIVEDTNFLRTVKSVLRFIKKNSGFQPDPECEKFLMTYNPGGYLKRQS